jgi:hypothetical protein
MQRLALIGLLVVGGCRDSGDDEAPYVCPELVPSHDGECDRVHAECTYMSCDEFGVATATCRDDRRWDVETRACSEVSCEQETCAPGFICVRTVAGVPSGSCVENGCGEGPIGCECPGCGDLPCTSRGLVVECNACMSEICP